MSKQKPTQSVVPKASTRGSTPTEHSPSTKPKPLKSLRQPFLSETLPLGSKERTKLKSSFTPRTTHGGSLAIGKRKTTRPFISTAPLHLVMRATRAKGLWSLQHRKNRARITAMVYTYAMRFKVEIHQFGNAGNHLHILVQTKDRKALADFLRVLAGRIAVTVTGARKYVKRVGKFWDTVYFSRLVNWGRDFARVRHYVLKNEWEGFSKAHRRAFETGIDLTKEVAWQLRHEPRLRPFD